MLYNPIWNSHANLKRSTMRAHNQLKICSLLTVLKSTARKFPFPGFFSLKCVWIYFSHLRIKVARTWFCDIYRNIYIYDIWNSIHCFLGEIQLKLVCGEEGGCVNGAFDTAFCATQRDGVRVWKLTGPR